MDNDCTVSIKPGNYLYSSSPVGIAANELFLLFFAKTPKEIAMQIMSNVISLEKRILAMNAFIADLFQKMEAAGIKALLVKGQGIAQGYERLLWRACGDVDLFLDKENYEKAKAFLPSLASHVEDEVVYRSHLAMTIGPWKVARHGTLPSWDYDVILVFSHIMQSLFRGGIGLWQICDWCRLLWTYRDVSYQKPYPYMRSI